MQTRPWFVLYLESAQSFLIWYDTVLQSDLELMCKKHKTNLSVIRMALVSCLGVVYNSRLVEETLRRRYS